MIDLEEENYQTLLIDDKFTQLIPIEDFIAQNLGQKKSKQHTQYKLFLDKKVIFLDVYNIIIPDLNNQQWHHFVEIYLQGHLVAKNSLDSNSQLQILSSEAWNVAQYFLPGNTNDFIGHKIDISLSNDDLEKIQSFHLPLDYPIILKEKKTLNKNGMYKVGDNLFWYKDNLLHREDAPAKIEPYRVKEWYLDGEKHRLSGPAVEYFEGPGEYWIYGNKMSGEAFFKFRRAKKFSDYLNKELSTNEIAPPKKKI